MDRKTWAIVLSSVVPLLVLLYLVQSQVASAAAAGDRPRIVALPLLLFGAVTSLAGGAYLVWSLGRRGEGTRQGDEVVVGMLKTIEQQATEIRTLAERLDTAYRDLEMANGKAKRFSFRDDVTELYNRRYFLIRLEEEISRYRRFGHPVSVVLLDLDAFNDLNVELGHEAGDDALRDLARLLSLQSRDINVVARYGGDQFAVLLVETPRAGAAVYAERIRELVAAHAFPRGRRLTVSLGVASLPEDEGASAGDILRASDRALYGAKRAGRNRVGLVESPKPAS